MRKELSHHADMTLLCGQHERSRGFLSDGVGVCASHQQGGHSIIMAVIRLEVRKTGGEMAGVRWGEVCVWGVRGYVSRAFEQQHQQQQQQAE